MPSNSIANTRNKRQTSVWQSFSILFLRYWAILDSIRQFDRHSWKSFFILSFESSILLLMFNYPLNCRRWFLCECQSPHSYCTAWMYDWTIIIFWSPPSNSTTKWPLILGFGIDKHKCRLLCRRFLIISRIKLRENVKWNTQFPWSIACIWKERETEKKTERERKSA